MTLKFTPEPNTARWAVVRNGGIYKVYNRLGDAKNAVHAGYSQDQKILERVDSDWFVLYDCPGGLRPWQKSVTRRVWLHSQNKYREYDRNVSVPMTRDEYADWRIKVFKEQNGLEDAVL